MCIGSVFEVKYGVYVKLGLLLSCLESFEFEDIVSG